MRNFSPFVRGIMRIGMPGLLLLFLLTGCGTGASTSATGTSNTTSTTGVSKSTPTSSTGKIAEFPVTASGIDLIGITSGPDHNLWFSEYASGKIGRITPSSTVTEFALSMPSSEPMGITAGPDGNLWFTDKQAGKIGQFMIGK